MDTDLPDTLDANTDWPALNRAMEAAYQRGRGKDYDQSAYLADLKEMIGKAGMPWTDPEPGTDLSIWGTGYPPLDKITDTAELMGQGHGGHDVGMYLLDALNELEEGLQA